ncbi:MAG: hypothetical protein U1E29_17120, partial [Coriobacteriia bacterium]|nr:hypothetical protein [Coriobacteriia bacterium]
MNAVEVIKEGLATVRASAPLRGLGVLSVLNAVLIAVFIIVIITTLMMFATVDVTTPGITERIDAFVLSPAALSTALVILAALTLVSAGLSVLQVAAIGGLVTESNAVLRGDTGSVGEGLKRGLSHFLRTAAIWALQLLPQLAVLMAETVIIHFTFTLPLQAGLEPSPDAFGLAQALVTPLSLLSSLVTIPLHIVVMLALRFGLIERMAWREAIAAGWSLAKSCVAEVALVYLLLMLAGMAVGVVAAIVISVLVALGVTLAASAFFTLGTQWSIVVAALVCVAIVPIVAVVGGWY